MVSCLSDMTGITGKQTRDRQTDEQLAAMSCPPTMQVRMMQLAASNVSLHGSQTRAKAVSNHSPPVANYCQS
jgi:hypothetical protein